MKLEEMPPLLTIKKEPVIKPMASGLKVEAKVEVKLEPKVEPKSEEKLQEKPPSESSSASLQPISIEIPAQVDGETPRIRTRASSRLESPLDAQKASPDPTTVTGVSTTAATAANASTTVKSLSRASSTASPRVVTPTPNHNNNNNKRRRQESECGSSNDGADLGENSIKRPRISSGTTSNNNATETAAEHNAGAGLPKKVEIESSDSDEPLIEVAGKVRNSKQAQVEAADAAAVGVEKHVTRRNAQQLQPPQNSK